MAHKGPKNPERAFGVSVGIVLMLVAGYLFWRERMLIAQITGGIGFVLAMLGWLQPSWLYYPSKAWWKLAMVLGYVNARIILTIVFAIVLTPMSMVWRLIGRDPLQRRRKNWQGWSAYPERYRNKQHFTRMY
ncbi:MAG TPA: SxtJ family membrane protein [Vicinamibacterales bacterium]|nr:SxtJ family membrane protein [Vicinamibacterales bacterium]